jgi:hypothetical protein
MISFAPLLYRNILARDGGPVKKIVHTEIELANGLPGFECSVFLNHGLVPASESGKNKLYGNPDGTGADAYKSVACYKAISEALERWAYYNIVAAFPSNFSFDQDPSSNGMAAFPSLLKSPARKMAIYEALERWSLIEWWSGHLPSKFFSTSSFPFIEIKVPKVGSTVISWKKMKIRDFSFVSYGFAAGKNQRQAFDRSTTELLRNESVLLRYYQSEKRVESSSLCLQEQRLIYFSTLPGFEIFESRVADSESKTCSISPILICDKELIGPWSMYTTVWRCLFQTTISFDEMQSRLNFFF